MVTAAALGSGTRHGCSVWKCRRWKCRRGRLWADLFSSRDLFLDLRCFVLERRNTRQDEKQIENEEGTKKPKQENTQAASKRQPLQSHFHELQAVEQDEGSSWSC